MTKRIEDADVVDVAYYYMLRRMVGVRTRPRDGLHRDVVRRLWEMRLAGSIQAFVAAAAVAQITEYARTGRLSDGGDCTWPSVSHPVIDCDVEIDGATVRLAPVRAHAALVSNVYWRKACKPVRPGPAARALVALGLATPATQRYVEALLHVRKPPENATMGSALALLEKYIGDRDVINEVSGVAGLVAPVARWSNAPLGPLAAAVYVIAFVTGYRYASLAGDWQLIMLRREEDDPEIDARRCLIAVEFCKHNIYVWSPVRRYRLPARPAGVIDVLHRVVRETMRVCPHS